MKYAVPLTRWFLGIIFFVEGVDGLIHIFPPWPVTPEGQAFLTALEDTGYLWTLVKVTEAVCGLALLANRFVPLALTVLAPVVLNIVLFQLFLGEAFILPFDFLVVALGAFLAWVHRSAFRGRFESETTPRFEPTGRCSIGRIGTGFAVTRRRPTSSI